MEIELKPNRVALQKIKKTSLLTSQADQNYDYEPYKFKVVAIGKDVEEKYLNSTILKQKGLGIEVELDGQELIIIRDEDILAKI